MILLTLSIFLLVANYAWGQIADPLATGLNGSVPTDDADLINNQISQTGGGIAFFDTLLPFLLIGVFGFVMISAGAIMKNPIMIFVGVILFGVIITLAVVYSNVYGNLIDTDLGSVEDDVAIGSLFMQYLPYIIAVGILLVIVAVGARSGGSSGL